ncbi:MAG: NAD(P)H-hydrate dehydratase [Myxococcales bacterium]|nr:NAD(P)H-hydrate dehydratase [Myxococcales bacterium]
MKVCTRAQIREVDRLSIEEYGLPGVVLMEAAGRGVVDVIAVERALRGAAVLVLAGGGNNGGDGFVIARHLIARGAEVTTLLLGDPSALAGDARLNYDVLAKMGGAMRPLVDDADIARESGAFAAADVIVDAIFGTGLTREVGGHYRRVIELANRAPRALRVAVDIPSGLDADSGEVLGVVFAADHTVTFAYPKLGMVSHPGFERVGKLHLVDIGVPANVAARAEFCAELLERDDVRRRLIVRPAWGHKGTYGHLLLIAGSRGKSGAALLAGEAALRAGVGLCTIASDARTVRALENKTRELMLAELVAEGHELDDSDVLFERLARIAEGKDAIAIGPGLARDAGSKRFVTRLLREAHVPVVIDADALNDLVGQLDVLAEAAVPVLLTPHPGEMSRLAGRPVPEVQANRYGVATGFAVEHGVYLALKGARTVIAEPDGRAAINPTGNSGMGSGGTGDVLTGLVGSFLAQHHPPADALVLAVYLHGAAGDHAAKHRGQRALIASDLIDAVPTVLRDW